MHNLVFNAKKFFLNRVEPLQGDPANEPLRDQSQRSCYIAALYKGRNRTFFTYGYEGFKLVEPPAR